MTDSKGKTWVKVEDGLPRTGTPMTFVKRRGHPIPTCRQYDGAGVWRSGLEITHWMYVPPIEESER